MSDDPPAPERQRYELAFLTDQWEWEAEVVADTRDAAKAAARSALEALVREESPQLACVTLIDGGAKIGVWDWMQTEAHWTPL